MSLFFPFGLRLGGGKKADNPNVAYDGKRREIPTTATSTYPRLRDLGKKPADNARIYSGQMLDFDGVDDYVAVGDISASCKSLEITLDPETTTEGVIQLASGVSVSISSGAVSTTGLTNVTTYVNGVAGSTVAAEMTVLALTFDAVSCSDVKLAYDGSAYFDGLQGNIKLWTATLDSDDVAFSYANPETPAYNRPGTSLVEADLTAWYPLISGSGDTAYAWAGSVNGVLTGFANTEASWANGAGLSDPRCLQTALMEWGYADGVLCPLNTTDVSRSITDESFTSSFDVAVSLDHSNLTASTVTVTTTDGATTYAEGTDYTIDYTNGAVTVLSTGTMADATAFYIDYGYKVDATNFTRDYNELNFNGRSWADCGNGADVNPSSALIVECVVKVVDSGYPSILSKGSSYQVYRAGANLKLRVFQGGVSSYGILAVPEETSLHHYIFVATNDNLYSYIDGGGRVNESSANAGVTFDIVTDALTISLPPDELTSQLPLLNMTIDSEAQKIIDGDLDAWVTKRYNKAKVKYGL